MHERYILRSFWLGLLLTVAVWIDPGSRAMAQTACTQELTDAEQAYTFGRFDEAIRLLNQCLNKANVTEAERQRTYRLIGLSYIGKDLVQEARESVRRLLQLVPDYRPDPDQDPPPFVELVEDVRQEMRREARQAETPPADRTPAQVAKKRGGAGKWLLIGGGVVLAAVAAAVLLSGGGDDEDDPDPPGPTTLDEQEPNNTPAQAQVIRGNPPITVRGNIAAADMSDLGRTLDDGSFDDFEDWYRVTITQPGIQITLSGIASDCDLYLMETGTLNYLSISDNPGVQAESINISNQQPGTYLIGVSIFDIDPQGAPTTAYTLTVTGAVSGSNLRVVTEQIRRPGGADLAGTLHLVANPGDAGVPLGAVLPDPGATPWTAFHDQGGTLLEYDGTETFHFRPGRGFWVQSTTPIDGAGIAASAPVPPGGTFSIALDEGWNIIANPYDAPLDWAAVQAANGITQRLWRWDGRFIPADTFEPARRGAAYYFLNLTREEALALPRPGTAATPFASRPRLPDALTLSAYREGRLASTVQVGLMDEAAPGLDGYDQFAPPGYFEAAGLRLMRQVSPGRRVALAEEYRPWGEAGHRFDLVLDAPAHAPVELRVEGLAAFAGYDVFLVDQGESTAHDLHAHPMIVLPGSLAEERRLTLVVGTASFTRAIRDELVPEMLSLGNYPNPFNPSTQITYTLPAAAAREAVQLAVYDVAGHRVRMLVDGLQEPGTHRVTWDGTDASGMPVASGVYFYRLQAGAHTQVRQMLLMK